MSYPERTVVTGAGLAGFRTVEELRRRGYSGQITLIGAEDRAPYDRPPLSKKVLTSGIDPALQADFAALEADFRPGETAVALEAPAPAAPPAVPASTPHAQPDECDIQPPLTGSLSHSSAGAPDPRARLLVNSSSGSPS
jgi:hypothetical protein